MQTLRLGIAYYKERISGMDNQQCPLREMALFAGAGGGILGGHLLGWKTVCAVEWESYPASVLAARQNDGILPPFPIWDDVQTFDGKPWRGLVDVVSGGFPCQDISCAGRGAGIEGERSSMWKHMARIISEVRPQYAFMENSPLLVPRGLAVVISDLAEIGYDCRWGCLSASELGAEHERDRIWIVAADTNMSQCERRSISSRVFQENPYISYPRWGKDKPGVDRVSNGMAARMDRLKAVGNGQVPIVAATAFQILSM